MAYWIVCTYRSGKWYFISGTDQHGNPEETTNKAEAWKFYRFESAWSYLSLGYIIHKEYI